MTRWTTLLIDEAALGELPALPAEDVLRHADLVAARKPKPIDLYQRWERQQWSAEELSLGRDHDMFADERVPAGGRCSGTRSPPSSSVRDINLDGIKTAFVAMGRDESRRVSFGLHALRTGIQEGHAEEIYGVLEEAAPLALRLDDEFAGIAVDFRAMSVDILRRHLAVIGADPTFTAHLLDRYSTRTAAHRPTDPKQE